MLGILSANSNYEALTIINMKGISMNKLTKMFVAAIFLAAAGVAQASEQIGEGLDGMWFSPLTNGQGVVINYNHRTDGSEDIVLTMYTFTSDGSNDQAWVYASGDLVGRGGVLKVISSTGGKFNVESIVPQFDRTNLGSVTVELSQDCGSLNVSWFINSSALGIVDKGSRVLSRLSVPHQHGGVYTCSGQPVQVTAPDCAGVKPAPETKNVAATCPANQSGTESQYRSYSCVNHVWTASDWITTGSSCEAAPNYGMACIEGNATVNYMNIAAWMAKNSASTQSSCVKIDGKTVVGGFGPCYEPECHFINGYTGE
jgi:hypothetical protein